MHPESTDSQQSATEVDQIRPILGALCDEVTAEQMEQLCRVWDTVNSIYTPAPGSSAEWVEDPAMTEARSAGLVSAAELLLGRLTFAETEARRVAAADAFDAAAAEQEEAGGPGADVDVDRRHAAADRALTMAAVAAAAVRAARHIKHMAR